MVRTVVVVVAVFVIVLKVVAACVAVAVMLCDIRLLLKPILAYCLSTKHLTRTICN